ncbi:MAG: hypothetical protein CL489_03010 [Acidobacteria bacterium]|nr:hypothetical protein [Acidobacteriota bacterium]
MPRIEKFFAGSKVEDWTSDSVGAAAGGGAIYATGGTTYDYVDPADGKTYIAHEFTSTDYFEVVAGDFDVEVLVVAGGGGGGYPAGYNVSGGAGAGGVREFTAFPVSSTGGSPDGPGSDGKYLATIGAGSPDYSRSGSPTIWGNDPTYESFGGGSSSARDSGDPTLTPNYPYLKASPGGSGGGELWPQQSYPTAIFPAPLYGAGVGSSTGPPGYTPAPPQGNPGGHSTSVYGPYGYFGYGGGGGGGAGATGGTATGVAHPVHYGHVSITSGLGGVGYGSALKAGSGSLTYYGGGGGGGRFSTDNQQAGYAGTGGNGGGGPGGGVPGGPPSPGNAGSANTGGGGGGGGAWSTCYGGAGGSGVIVLRYSLD